MVRPLPGVPGLGHVRGDRRAEGRAGASSRPGRPARRPGRSARSTSRPRGRGRPACRSWTGCSAAAWCPARWCCWPVSPASASPRCCSRSRSAGPRGTGPASPSLYVTGEESAGQVRLRAERTGNVHDAMYLAAESDLADDPRPRRRGASRVCWWSTRCRRMASPAVEGSAGGVTQVRAVTAALVALAKERGLPVVLVGHVTKDGSIAGPRVLEHLVDVVLHFEGDRHSTLRLVRGVKNRFGPADEVGCFELVDDGIRGVADPSGLFLNRRDTGVPGTAVTVAVEGKRPLLGEVQALVSRSALATPRRAVCGLDSARVAMVLAVLERRGGIRLSRPGRLRGDGRRHADRRAGGRPGAGRSPSPPPRRGVRYRRTWWCSARSGWPARSGGSPGCSNRLAEAARLGFTKALIPPDCGEVPDGIRVRVCPDLGRRSGRAGGGRGRSRRLRGCAVGPAGAGKTGWGRSAGGAAVGRPGQPRVSNAQVPRVQLPTTGEFNTGDPRVPPGDPPAGRSVSRLASNPCRAPPRWPPTCTG